MVESTAVALRLLELVALLFPVVALLLQLQYRAANSDDLEVVGMATGTGLLAMLAIAFVSIAGYLYTTAGLPPLLRFPVLLVALTSVLAPMLIAFTSERPFVVAMGLRGRIRKHAKATVEFLRRVMHFPGVER